ncbi:GntR family transcriptional regulator [Caulobacter sp. LARHSG274]
MGRDRDPFDRTLQTLRERLARSGPLQGAPLAVNGLAAEFGVSQTPVREVLARLAGEGLIVHTLAGYAGVTHGRESLADLYGLAEILAGAAVAGASPALASAGARSDLDAFDQALASGANRAVAAALDRARAQLAPFGQAERLVLGDQDRTAFNAAAARGAGPAVLAAQARRYFRRRARRAGDILARALGLA